MADFFIGRQQAENIIMGEKVDFHAAPAPPDHAGLAEQSLDAGDYQNAQQHFGEAVRLGGKASRLRFGLALASLHGHRPCRHKRATIENLRTQLKAAATPEAVALLLLVEEDYHTQWRSPQPMPAPVVSLLQQVAPASAAEIVRHVHAPECQTWKFLAARAADVRPS